MEPTATPLAAVENQNFIIHAFQSGGLMMVVIAFVGLATLFLIAQRYMKLKAMSIDKQDFTEQLYGMILRGDLRQALTYCDARPTPLTNTLKAGLVQVLNHRPDEEVQVAMDASVLRETPKVEGWTSFLAVFSNLATLLGLIGTIIGMIKSFQAVSKVGAAEKATLLSEGISEALHCTAFGLIVAVIAIIGYGVFQIRIGHLINDMTESSMTLLNLVTANRDKVKE